MLRWNFNSTLRQSPLKAIGSLLVSLRPIWIGKQQAGEVQAGIDFAAERYGD
ncbi:hypothetical protein [Labrys miyagiensis]|uniref:hypothetical protein n=1 Tax=Labrys miyagiensis TaxID=346912 RepID=UPI0024E0F684|nr:hypothetical protein [Labrys miyagiensis]